MKYPLPFFLLPVLCSFLAACAATENFVVERTHTPMPYQEMQTIIKSGDELMNKTKTEILARFGEPRKQKRYRIMGVERERFDYYFVEPDFIQRRLLLEIYFIDDIVTGFNIYSGDRPERDANNPRLDGNLVAGGF